MKYSKIIWEIGWSKLAKQCRGKVVDINTREIVSYPFNKFFNLDEVEETKQDKVKELLEKEGVKISVTETGEPNKDGEEAKTSKEEKTINTMKPLWKKQKSEISKEEYEQFYKDNFFDFTAPARSRSAGRW